MSDPLTPTGNRFIISQPRESWERVVGNPYINEAPEAIRDDRLQAAPPGIDPLDSRNLDLEPRLRVIELRRNFARRLSGSRRKSSIGTA